MTLPYQCLAACSGLISGNGEWALFGTTGSQLVVQSSVGTGTIWPPEEEEEEQQARAVEQKDEGEGPPEKRIKLSPPAEQRSNFSILKISSDNRYLIAVTAEDKCIRVFQIEAGWRLQQLSQRCMIKRPCSITLTADDSTILCADKFGDVYSLPLIPSPKNEQNSSPKLEAKEQQHFVPSASLLTVHSGRNRKTLEGQLKQAEQKRTQVKETPKFKHDLLLGHVSMLTDIAHATVGSRSYILTADRDEHIRVSRGPPQCHIIEGFCHGHEEFVSKLCITKSGRLVSGGGDAHLYIWDWLSYKLLERLPIRDAALDHYRRHPQLASTLPGNEDQFRVAVSGIWNVPCSASGRDEMLVTCEGIPALFCFTTGESPTAVQVLPLTGNALDVAFIEVRKNAYMAVVSVDHVHKPGSTTEARDEMGASRLHCFSYQQDGQWREDDGLAAALAWFSSEAGRADGRSGTDEASGHLTGANTDGKGLRDMLYGVEKLRKRPGAED